MNKRMRLGTALLFGIAAAIMTGLTSRRLGVSPVSADVIAIGAFMIYGAIGFYASKNMTGWRDLFIIRR